MRCASTSCGEDLQRRTSSRNGPGRRPRCRRGPARQHADRPSKPGVSMRRLELAPSNRTAETRPSKQFGRPPRTPGSCERAIASGRTKAIAAFDGALPSPWSIAPDERRRDTIPPAALTTSPCQRLVSPTKLATNGVAGCGRVPAGYPPARSALIHHGDPVRHDEGFGLVVGNVGEGGVEGSLELLELDHVLAQLEVEGAERLVQKNQGRLQNEAAGNRHALALAAGQCRHTTLAEPLETDALQHPAGAFLGFSTETRRQVSP